MEVQLLNYTPLWIASNAIRTCWQSFEKSDTVDGVCGEVDKALIDRVGNQFKHASTLEHVSYNFYISGISRACLQELARHRMASLSVKSTRYTLKELKEEKEAFTSYTDMYDQEYVGNGRERAEKYLVMTNNEYVNRMSILALDYLRDLLKLNIGNDIAKYALPESYKTELTWTINIRSLQNFLHLRTSKSALWEIRDLANEMYNKLPEDHKYLFTDFISKE